MGMSERTGIKIDQLANWIREIDGNHDKGAGAIAEELLPRIESALSRAESVIREGVCKGYMVNRGADGTNGPFHYGCDTCGRKLSSSNPCYSGEMCIHVPYADGQSGAIAEGDDWWGDPFGEWHPNQQPESILPCGIYIRLRFEHDTGYSYNSLDIVIEEESLTTSDIEEPWIGPFPSWIFRSRQSGAITEGDVDSVAKEIAKALPEVTDLYSRINPILRRALRSRQSGEQRGCVGADFDFGSQRCDCPRAECAEKGMCCFPNSSALFTEDTEKAMSDLRVNFTSNESHVIFSATDDHGVLKIAPDGFYVRGEKVPQDEHEARRIYDAFMEWMQATVFDNQTRQEVGDE